MTATLARRRPSALDVAAVAALVLLLVQAPFFLAAGLVAPAWAVVVLVALWLGAVGLAARWLRRHPARVLPLPLLTAAVWVVAITVGELLLGWTA